MQTFEMSNRSNEARRAWWSPRASILLGGAHAAVSIVILVITIFVLVGQEAGDRKDVGTNTHLEGFYITAEDQKLRDELSYRWINLSEGLSADDCKEVEGDMCLTNLDFHGCCKSKPQFVQARHVTALNGTKYTLAYGQVFPTENCTTTQHCSLNCECTLIDSMFMGYTDKEHTKWLWFLHPACCKCMNK